MNISKWFNTYNGEIFDPELAQTALDNFQTIVNKHDLIIYGAGTVSSKLIKIMNELGIQNFAIVDQNYAQIQNFIGYQVFSPETLKQTDSSNALIFVAVHSKNFNLIKEFITSLNRELGEIHCGHSLLITLISSLCTYNSHPDRRLDITRCNECPIIDKTCQALRRNGMNINHKLPATEGKAKKFQGFGYVLGQKCTLNCKCCNESIPNIPQKSRVCCETVIKDIQKITQSTEFMTLIEFVGGEPFLHPDLYKIIEYTCNISNVGVVKIFTNGTVVPSDETCRILQHQKIDIYISNYQAQLSDKLKRLVAKTETMFKQFNIQYTMGQVETWLDFSEYNLLNYTSDELKQQYKHCSLSPCHRLYNGVLYGCPHHYGGTMIGVFDSRDQTINIHDYTSEILAEKLDQFESYEYLNACKYCTLPFNANEVPAAVQV